MFKKNLNIIVFLIIIIAIMVVSSILTIFIVPNYFTEYTRIINLMAWLVLFVLIAPVENEHARFKGKYDKVKTVLIIVVIYYMIYFFLGVFYGYKKSPYSMAFFSIIKNMIFVVGLGLLREFVRSKLINANRNIKNYVLVTIIFILINLDYNNFFENFTSIETIFKFIVLNLLPQIAISCTCTYLAKTGGHVLIYAYRLPIMLVTVLLPIFPDVDYFLTSVMEVLVALIICILINYEHTTNVTRLTRSEKEEINPTKSVFSILFVIVLVAFIAGLLPFKPVAVMSNSMVPYFTRGYVVIVKKLNKDDVKNLQVGDILEYQLDKSMILHRIKEIESDSEGNLLFTTQGDNNDFPDVEKVKEEQVVGIIKFKIPYLGYPSVWFSELLLKRNSNIRT